MHLTRGAASTPYGKATVPLASRSASGRFARRAGTSDGESLSQRVNIGWAMVQQAQLPAEYALLRVGSAAYAGAFRSSGSGRKVLPGSGPLAIEENSGTGLAHLPADIARSAVRKDGPLGARNSDFVSSRASISRRPSSRRASR